MRILKRPLRILWIVLGALLLVSLLPIGLYHRQVLGLSQEKLVSAEKLQQNEVTRSLTEELLVFESTLQHQLIGLRQSLLLTGLIHEIETERRAQQLSALLENFVGSNPNVLYVTVVGKRARGRKAGDFQAEADPFVSKLLQSAFAAGIQRLDFRSDPLALAPDNRPAFVVSLPLFAGEEFKGMLAGVVSLERIQARLQVASVRGRVVYVADRKGRVVVHPQAERLVPGTEIAESAALIGKFIGLPPEMRVTETVNFTVTANRRSVEMTGTFSTVPESQWAVVAYRSLEAARADAGVDELNRQALTLALLVAIAAAVVGVLFAQRISAPIRGLADSTRAISRGEFHERAPVRGAAEISELASTFNKMAGDIEQYIEQLKQAAEINRELFIGSIRMLSAAIDEKDPYTRGHSGRVAKYSVIIGTELGLMPEDLDRLRISALLHDVGKIGIDDRVLKKPGSLTPEEFELMKQHPVKGANIMRPVAQLKEMLPGIELHHESMDGRGYPHGLRGDQIPLMARIISVADTLDAITTSRPYQEAMDITFAMKRIRQLAGPKFDPTVVGALEQAVGGGKLRLTATLVEV